MRRAFLYIIWILTFTSCMKYNISIEQDNMLDEYSKNIQKKLIENLHENYKYKRKESLYFEFKELYKLDENNAIFIYRLNTKFAKSLRFDCGYQYKIFLKYNDSYFFWQEVEKNKNMLMQLSELYKEHISLDEYSKNGYLCIP